MSQDPERSNFPESLALREQGLSFAEISERTGETREAIRQRIARSQSSSVDAPPFRTSCKKRSGINTSVTPTRSSEMSQQKYEKVANSVAAKQLADLSRILRIPSYAEVEKIAVAELWKTVCGK
jgi:hypothetical protein